MKHIMLLGTERKFWHVLWFSRSGMAIFACHARRIKGRIQRSLSNPDPSNPDPYVVRPILGQL
jgi:hypothetical protein